LVRPPQWGRSRNGSRVQPRSVVVALRESARGRRSRLVDHETARRRECLKAVGDVWAALIQIGLGFELFKQYLDIYLREIRRAVGLAGQSGEAFEDVGDEQVHLDFGAERERVASVAPSLFWVTRRDCHTGANRHPDRGVRPGARRQGHA
jgi:hypothetical protein